MGAYRGQLYLMAGTVCGRKRAVGWKRHCGFKGQQRFCLRIEDLSNVTIFRLLKNGDQRKGKVAHAKKIM